MHAGRKLPGRELLLPSGLTSASPTYVELWPGSVESHAGMSPKAGYDVAASVWAILEQFPLQGFQLEAEVTGLNLSRL